MHQGSRDELFIAVRKAAVGAYGDRLAALAIFGSWARGTATPASDLDLLVVGEPLPPSRKEREFSFDGDIDFIPTDEYDADDADVALGQARLAAACLGRLLGGAGPV